MTGRVAQRLADLEVELPSVAAPVGAYVPALVDGDHVLTSGQLPVVDGEISSTGVVGTAGGGPAQASTVDGAVVTPEEATALARTCAINALAAVRHALGGDEDALDRVEQVVKVVGYVASAPGFTGQPGVVDGASQLLGEVFGDAGVHARSAVGVAALPLGAPVEVELTVRVRG